MSDAVTTFLVNVDVSDLERAIEFYTAGIGLSVRRRPYPGIVELQGGSSPVFLTEKRAGTLPFPESSRQREYGRHWTPIHLDFVVSDLERAIRRAESAGARSEGSIREYDEARYAILSDPFGNGFCLLQWKEGADRDLV